MIRNARQYCITHAQLAKLEQAFVRLSAGEEGTSVVPPRLRQAEHDALKSQIEDLCAQLAAYDALRTRKHPVLRLTACEEFPQALIQARIATGMRQKDLARRLGLEGTAHAARRSHRLCGGASRPGQRGDSCAWPASARSNDASSRASSVRRPAMSTRTLLESTALQAVLTHRVWDYALRRQQAVQAGHETAALAGLLTQTYGYGLVEAVRALLGPDGELVATRLLAAVEQTVAHLDPAWDRHATQRWAARPARLAYD